ncbi:Metal ABC transporter substrate-binding protein [Rhodovastum atsumiense]|uniref:Metal ABC transporter substrate-binding protein n=1 Tax=Rhodovastum atsumiense TaxID=504468 RepID=A0A5M6IJQ1_9PROT|nr:zinc ABC transporter substrate-binding protein [Rhodovastum atsumiense]KAA5608117.1 metal ABC transporter substrate-binding protein [Rhodovastum atsumiense]CAH2600771.1 Metal ABC transporter substrate-binding protein [Rhodovastum atsumiense]
MYRRRMLFTLAGAAIAGPIARAEQTVPVVASFSILADMVRQIGGSAVSVRSLVPPDGDAHTYEPRPSDLQAVHSARLVVINGLAFEGWMQRLLPASGYQGPVVTTTEGVTSRTMREESGQVATDPHAWQDPRNGVIYARNIGEGLAKAVPDHAAAFRAAAADYARRIAETDAWIEKQIAAVPPGKRRILTSHDAFGYFGARYGIEFHGIEGISTESEPSAASIAALVKLIHEEGIKAVFVENMTSPRIARTVARESGAVLGPAVYSDALSQPGGPADTYLKMFRHNVPLFVKAMMAN